MTRLSPLWLLALILFLLLVVLASNARAAPEAIGHIGATVCSIVPLINEDGTDSGLSCMDCGDGCLNQIQPASGTPTTQQETPVLTIIDTGENQ